MSVYEASITNPKKQLEFYKQLSEQLQVENKQLKQKYEMQKDSNKLLCKAITCDDCDCSVCEAHKENIELKKQLEKKYSKTGNLTNEILYEENTKLINQQKEFIEYLEKEIVDCKAGSGQQYYAQEHLKMFKEIIGEKE